MLPAAATKNLYMVFMDLEKAFETVPSEVDKWVLREVDVKE